MRICRLLSVVLPLVAAQDLTAQDVKLAEEKPGMIARAKVSYDSARAVALRRVPGAKLLTAELEQEDGKLIYTLVYKSEGKAGVDEVNVDAMTGRIVAFEHEKSEPKPPKPPARKGR